MCKGPEVGRGLLKEAESQRGWGLARREEEWRKVKLMLKAANLDLRLDPLRLKLATVCLTLEEVDMTGACACFSPSSQFPSQFNQMGNFRNSQGWKYGEMGNL